MYGFVCAGGRNIGVLTSSLNWHWIFLVNLPIGVAVYWLTLRVLPENGAGTEVAKDSRLDFAGAATVTAALMLAVYAVVNGNEAGWVSAQTLALLAGAGVLFAAFIAIEACVGNPQVPLRLFKGRNLATANVAGAMWAASMFAWMFISVLHLQLVLGYSAMQVGLAFLTTNVIMAVFSLGLSARLVLRFGLKPPLVAGLLIAALGLALFALAPVNGNFWWHVLPGMLLLGLGAGIAFNPVLLAAMNDVAPDESGLVSGIVNTSFMMGGALGLAVRASLAAARTGALAAAGTGAQAALNGGCQWAFVAGAVFAAVAAMLGAYGLAGGVAKADGHG